MKVEVVMPKMGESLQEGTILKWLKQPGDKIERDEMILEISTDKVDTEVPAPVGGILAEILAGENVTVEVGKVIAYIETDAVAISTPPQVLTEEKAAVTLDAPATEPSAASDAHIAFQAVPAATGNLVDIVMPKMGESLQEGTILKWLKKPGDKVERDEMILEISTDKVDTEVPSPVGGILAEILAGENETVEVGSVIARIATDEGSAKTTAQPITSAPSEVKQPLKP
ncbi:MAG: hypothetical protein QG635_400, partial [Bacteroidota bacterium]|nr:hypothetical protein [Bacteroidota bacterium]